MNKQKNPYAVVANILASFNIHVYLILAVIEETLVCIRSNPITMGRLLIEIFSVLLDDGGGINGQHFEWVDRNEDSRDIRINDVFLEAFSKLVQNCTLPEIIQHH